MANPWFRMYAEFATDPKVQMMSEAHQRRFVMLLCLRCCNGNVTLHDDEVAFQLRITADDWAQSKALFLSKNLITDDNAPVAWDKRQYVSDSSAERVRRHRENKKRVGNVTETPPDTDSDTEKKPTTPLPPSQPAAARPAGREKFNPRAVQLPDCVPLAAWETWCSHRSSKRQALTEVSVRQQLKFLVDQHARGSPPEKVIAQSVRNGWTGLFELKGNGSAEGRRHGDSAVERVRRNIEGDGYGSIDGECQRLE